MVILVIIIIRQLRHTSLSLVKVVYKLLNLQQQRFKFLVHFVLKSKENILSLNKEFFNRSTNITTKVVCDSVSEQGVRITTLQVGNIYGK